MCAGKKIDTHTQVCHNISMSSGEDLAPANTGSWATEVNFGVHHAPIDPSFLPVLPDQALVLDLGCGVKDSGVLTELLRVNNGNDLRVARADFFPGNLHNRRAKDRAAAVACDALSLPFLSGLFDAVVISELTIDNPYFEVGPRRSSAVGEIMRVLKLGGYYVAYNEHSDMAPPKDEIETLYRIFGRLVITAREKGVTRKPRGDMPFAVFGPKGSRDAD